MRGENEFSFLALRWSGRSYGCVATRIRIFHRFPIIFLAFHIVQWMDKACMCKLCVHMNYVLACMVADASPHRSTRNQNRCDIKYKVSSTFRQQHLGKCKRKYTNNITTCIYTDNIFTIFISIGITVATSTSFVLTIRRNKYVRSE